jgi:hypothetical protein
MDVNVLMYASTIINFVSYFPEFIEMIKNKNKNLYSIPERGFILISGILGLFYSIEMNDNALFINFISIITLDTFLLLCCCYYSFYNGFSNVPHLIFINKSGKEIIKQIKDVEDVEEVEHVQRID